MDATRLTSIGGMVLALCSSGVVVAQEPRMPHVRIAELEFDPARLDAYKASVKEAMEESVRVEPRFFEIYADEAAYSSHRESPHFKKYVARTKDMIKSRKLIETVPPS